MMTRNPEPPGTPQPQTPAPGLFDRTDAEDWMWNRLHQLSCPLYVDRPFDSLKDRIRFVILREGYGPVIAGKLGTKPETFQDAFERLFGEPLYVPRETNNQRKVKA
jgi:hypothetical protein